MNKKKIESILQQGEGQSSGCETRADIKTSVQQQIKKEGYHKKNNPTQIKMSITKTKRKEKVAELEKTYQAQNLFL